MKRSGAGFLLTAVVLLNAAAQGPGGRPGSEATDFVVRAVRGIGPANSSRFCVGAGNSVGVALAVTGLTPIKPVALRLVMVLPGGDPAGQLIAEGSTSFPAGSATASFTFLNVDVPSRLQGRGALLEVRVNHGVGVPEQNLSNNGGTIALDAITDWSCR
jgi:hypothetical protein